MKKIRLFTLFASIIMLALLVLTGCDAMTNDKIASIALKDHDQSTAIELPAGEFDCSAYTLVVTYESGNTEEVALTDEMISEADKIKFYQIGNHDITVSYGKQTYVFKVSIKRLTFDSISLPENNVFTYDGTVHTVEVQGNIPANAVVTYTGENSFVNAGTYDVTAIVSCEGYVTAKLSTTVKIERAKYDMSSVKLDSKEVVYDGNPHSVEISGTLPEGVSAPTYTINGQMSAGAIDVGEYTVTAIFANNNPNYEPIPNMQTTLKITPAEYVVDGVELVFKREDGNVISGALKVYDGASVIFDLNDYGKLSNAVSVSFSVYDKDGKLISSSNRNTNIINAGVYTVKAEFTLADSHNYKPIDPIVATFEVMYADYKTGDISFNSNYFIYDGIEHSIELDGTLPEGVSVSYEYYLGDTLVVDSDHNPVKSVANAGVYTVKAKLTVNDANYAPIPEMTATLKIDKIKIDAAALGLLGDQSVEYNGQPYKPSFKTWQEATEAKYDVLNYSTVKYYVRNSLGEYVEMGENNIPINAGFYRFVITVSIDDQYVPNYVLQNGGTSQTFTVDFEIRKKTLDVPIVNFEGDGTMVYNTKGQSVAFDCEALSENVTITKAYFKLDGGKYVAMGANELPTNVGSYRFVVTARINDVVNYVFANDKILMDYVCELEMDPLALEIPEVEFTYSEQVEYNGEAHPVEFTYAPDSEFFDVSTAYYKLVGDGYVAMAEGELPTVAGSYKYVVTATINNENCLFETTAEDNTTTEASVEFTITRCIVPIPECYSTNGTSFVFNYKEQSANLAHNADTNIVEVWHNIIKVGSSDGDGTVSLRDAGKYQLVATAKIRDTENYVFESGNTVETITVDWEILPREIVAPDVNITNTETEFDYDGKQHPVEYDELEMSRDYKVYTLYYMLVDGEYVEMASNEIPTDAGKYKGVVRATPYEPGNCIFEGGEASLSWEYEFEIKKLVIAVPEFTITQEARVLYSGQEQPFQFTSTVESELITITYHYTRYGENGEIAMDTAHPLHVGKYECYITATINDPNCVFANGETEVVMTESFEYEIYKHVINIDELGWCTKKEYISPDADNIPEYDSGSPFCVLEGESYEDFKKYVKWSEYDLTLFYFDPYEGNYTFVDDIYERGPGVYEATYTITVYNSSSCVLIYNSEETHTVTITVYFKIV